MSYNIKTLVSFEKQAKRLIKKYPSLKVELNQLISSLASDPEQGAALGNNCFKIRLAVASKGKGKSGGARIITHLVIREEIVYLVSIYDKSEVPSISNNDIEALLTQIK
jgi:mRNA-degrading endonuclease RelE of RelBE toxin-antitoxin system